MSTLKKRSKSIATLEKPTCNISIPLFENLFVYMLSDFRKKTFVNKLNVFFNTVNVNVYRENAEVSDIFKFITIIINNCVDNGINDTNLIKSSLLESPKNGEEFEELLDDFDEMIENFDATTALYVENEFVSRLNFVKIQNPIERMRNLINRYDLGDYDTHDEIVSDIKSASSSITKTITAKSTSNITIPDLDLGSPDIINHLDNVRTRMNDGKLKIKTGIKRLNRILNGGFEPGRVYFFLGLTGGLTFRSL